MSLETTNISRYRKNLYRLSLPSVLMPRCGGTVSSLAGAMSALILLFFISCTESGKSECSSNVDCGAKATVTACVNDVCIEGKDKCETLGVLTEVAVTSPQNAEEVIDLHITFDAEGALHYCYYGLDVNAEIVSYYGQQVSTEEFIEEPILVDNAPVACAALTVTESGTPYVLLKQPAMVIAKVGDQWKELALRGLTSESAESALRENDTLVSFSEGKKGSVFMSLSMGYNVTSQPVYIAKITTEQVSELINGWNEDDDPDFVGHSPKLFEIGGSREIVMGRLSSQSVVLADLDRNILAETEGVFPVSVEKKGYPWVLYFSDDHMLYLKRIEGYEFIDVASIGKVYPDLFESGKIPWQFSIDSAGRAHIVYEDESQGEDALVYQKINKNGMSGAARIVTDSLATRLVGGQLFDVVADFCGRPQIGVVEFIEEGDSGVVSTIRILAEI